MVQFSPSPVLTNAALGPAKAVAPDNNASKDDFLKKYPNIKSYLAMVARSAADQKIDPSFQAAVLAQENGGFERWSENAVSSAGAGGIAQFMPGTWAGDWNPYRNHSRNDPKYAIPAQAVYLRRLLSTYGGSQDKAAGAYNGGTPGNAAPGYVAGVKRYHAEIVASHVFSSSSGGGILSKVGDAASGILHGAEDVVSGPVKLTETLLDPAKLGELLSNAFAIFLKFVGKAIWNYVIAPPFHWCQRATVYYYEEIMGSKSGENTGYYYNMAAGATVAFWAVGYGILWRKSGDPSTPAQPEGTSLGKAINSATSLIAKRKVSAPNKVKDATPRKPAPVESKVSVSRVKTLSATRRRQVTVGTGRENARNRGNQDQENSANATAAENETESSENLAA